MGVAKPVYVSSGAEYWPDVKLRLLEAQLAELSKMDDKPKVIAVPQLGIREAREDYPHVWETVTHTFPWATPAVRAQIVSMIANICSACHAAPSSCRCWKDD